MQVLEQSIANGGLRPARRGRTAAIDTDPEPTPVADRPPTTVAEPLPVSVPTENLPGRFTAAEIRNMQRDDAMAAGTIAAVLGLAFMVLLSLTIGVNIWMQMIQP